MSPQEARARYEAEVTAWLKTLPTADDSGAIVQSLCEVLARVAEEAVEAARLGPPQADGSRIIGGVRFEPHGMDPLTGGTK